MSFQGGAAGTSFNKAYAAYEEGDQNKARAGFQKVLKESPGYPPALLAIAYSYMAEANLDYAERYARKALEIDSVYPQAHFLVAFILEQRHDYDGAIQELDLVRQARENYPGVEQARNILRLKATEIHLDRARHMAQNEPDAALQEYEKVRQMAPEVTQLSAEMAQVMLSHHRCKDAIQYLREALLEDPNDSDLQLKLADCLVETDQLLEAASLYESVLAAIPTPEIELKLADVRKTLHFRQMPEEYQAIPGEPQINRAQLAALLLTELPFLQQYKPASSEIMVDILNHWAKSYIQKAVDLGALEVQPNRTFEPQRSVTRLELARAATRLIQLLETAGKAPQNVKDLTIPDVPVTNINYPLVSTALSAGVLSLDGDGRFHAGRPVSGAEALSMVNRLKTLSE